MKSRLIKKLSIIIVYIASIGPLLLLFSFFKYDILTADIFKLFILLHFVYISWALNRVATELAIISENVQVGFWHFKNGFFDFQLDNFANNKIIGVFNQLSSFVARYIKYKQYLKQLEMTQKLSHDAKAPIATTKIALKSILKEKSIEKKIEKFQILHPFLDKSLDDSTYLIDKILEGEEKDNLGQPVLNLNDFTRSFVANVVMCYQMKDFQILAPIMPVFVLCYEDVLKRVIGNLIKNIYENAGAEKRVELRIEVDESHAIIKLTNWGSYIDDQMLEHLFTSKHSHGHGFGLPSSHELIASQNGKLVCSSNKELNEVCFTLWLPLSHSSQLVGNK